MFPTDSLYPGPFWQKRRRLLQQGGLGLLGLSLPQLLAARARAADRPAPRAKACILLFMWGGPAQQETWDLKPEAPVEIRGEFQPISTAVPGIQISEHFPLLARRTGELAIIRSMTHTDVNHTSATHYLLTGHPPPPSGNLKDDWPHIGAVLSQAGRGRGPLPPFVSMRPKLENTVPRFVEESHGQFAGWLGARYDPLTIDDNPASADYRVGDFALREEIPSDRLDRRQTLLADLESERTRRSNSSAIDVLTGHYERAFQLLNSDVGRSAFDLSQEPEPLRERYGKNPHGQSVLQARRLIERGVPLVTVFWPNDGIKNVSVYWDTHSRNFIDLKERLMPAADRAFAALLDDLGDRGLLDETLIVWTGEFGRTPRVGQRNSDAGAGRDGRDHWPNVFSSVLAGGGIRGGSVYGASDRHAAYPARDAVSPLDLASTVYELLGVDPHHELRDGQGRPFVLCPGHPLRSLYS